MYVYKQLASLSIILSILTACSKEQVCQQADFVLLNTKIYTATNDYPEAEALAILGDKLIFVGSNKEALSFACNENKTLDYSAALNALPRHLTQLYTHAYQSYVWNRLVSERLNSSSDCRKVLVGDLIVLTRSSFILDSFSGSFEITEVFDAP